MGTSLSLLISVRTLLTLAPNSQRGDILASPSELSSLMSSE